MLESDRLEDALEQVSQFTYEGIGRNQRWTMTKDKTVAFKHWPFKLYLSIFLLNANSYR